MASSPTPSLDSMRGANSIESYEHAGYLSDSPLTLSGSSPPASDSAICSDEYTVASSAKTSNVTVINAHLPISASSSCSSSSSSSSSSSASSTSSTSGLSGCGSTSSSVISSANVANVGPGVIGSNLQSSNANNTNSNSNANGNGNGNVSSLAVGAGKGSVGNANGNSNNNINANGNGNGANGSGSGVARCTACKSKCSDAVAKCFDCLSYLCANCVTAHEFMHCFNGHNVCLIKGFEAGATPPAGSPGGAALTQQQHNNPASSEFKYASSLTMMLQQQQQTPHETPPQPMSQLSKIVLAAAANSQEQQQQHQHEALYSALHQQLQPPAPTANSVRQLFCPRHKHELLKFSCRTCCTLVCKECIVQEHSVGLHELENVQSPPALSSLSAPANCGNEAAVQTLLADMRGKIGEIVAIASNSEQSVTKNKLQYQKAHNELNETHQFFASMLDERKVELLKELESLYTAKVSSNAGWLQRSKELIDKGLAMCEAVERAQSPQLLAEALLLRKTLEQQLQQALQEMQLPFELEFMSNYQSIQAGVRNTFGYIRATSGSDAGALTNGNAVGSAIIGGGGSVGGGLHGKQPPIARPLQSASNSSASSAGSHHQQQLQHHQQLQQQQQQQQLTLHGLGGLGLSTASLLESGVGNGAYSNGGGGGGGGLLGARERSAVEQHFGELLPKQRYNNSNAVSHYNPYEKWSNGGSDNLFSSVAPSASSAAASVVDAFATQLTSLSTAAAANNGSGVGNCSTVSSESLLDLTNKLLSASIYPPKSQIKRQKMIYHCKFGEFGVMEGQFTEPSGVAVNAQNDIIVADTNNHRIQIFDKEGRFKFQFGECGKRDSQLLYPNRVAVVRNSGDIIVTERSPTHQIQIYNQYGQFVRKFGATILQHPRGVTVDNKGRIIVVECKVMRVIIFDQNGNVLHKFGCSKHLEFPNGVVVNDKQEIFISDNRAHCVKVFNYEGQYLRQIGGEGITNYPIGVGINSNGEILIADNHNNFNLTIFTQDGQLISALESKVKHAQCFDVALMDDGSVVLASKDYRLYIYRYVQLAPVGM